MRTTVVSVSLVLMLLSLAFLPAVNVTSQGTAPAVIVKIEDYGQMNVVDQLYDYLVINFSLYVTKAGHFRITGSLIYPGLSPISTNTTIKTLSTGSQSIEVKFPSIPIFAIGKDGNFLVQYYIKNDTMTYEQGNYTTKVYNHMEFNSPDNFPNTPAKYIPTIVKESSLNRYVIRNDVMTVYFYYKTKVPRLVWFYTMDNKSRTKYNCEFEGIHGFIKGAAGRFQPSNSKYDGAFEAGNISSSSYSTGKSKIFGDYVIASVVISDVPVRESSSGNALDLANVTLTVMLAAGDRTVNYESNKYYTIYGGTQLSLNLDIDLRFPLAMNGLAIEQTLWSETNKSYNHDFRFEDASSTDLPRESTDPNDYEFFPAKEPQTIDFISKNTQEHKAEGYFYWFNRAQVDGTSSLDIMTYQYKPKDHKLVLYLAFTTSKNSITSVRTEPLGIGVNEDGNPSLQKYIKPKPAEQPSILITFIGWITAVILVALPLYVDFRRAQKRMEELEEEFGEDL
jgi:hypothetical protein